MINEVRNNLAVGMDIGIASCGIAVSDGVNLLYDGTRKFNSAKEASDSRKNRSQRRNLSRKKWRKEQLLDAFDDFGMLDIPRDQVHENGYLCFTTNNDTVKKPDVKTVYHLRKEALCSQISKRELVLCLYNILHVRGHFLMETTDFLNNDSVSFDDYKNLFYDAIEEYVVIPEESRKDFEDDILFRMYNGTLGKNNIKSKLKNRKFILENDEDEDALLEFCYLVTGYKAKLNKISDIFELKAKVSTVKDIKSSEEELPELFYKASELYDLANVSKILKDYHYLCEVAVDKLDEFDHTIEKYGKDSDEFNELKEKIKGKSNSRSSHIRSIRNLENNYPNGLLVKEARDILLQQQMYYPEITTEFIEICEDIISARIPYYIGPLSENAKNRWVTKTGNVKYSYAYSMKDKVNAPIDEAASIKAWKERMISKCSYLPEEFALPKGSFLAETFSIVNEMNILKAVDKDGNDYYLTQNDKISLFDKLFLIKKEITFQEVTGLLDLSSFGTRKNSSGKFNNRYTLYPSIAKILPDLRMNSILEIFENTEKVDRIENIILAINLYNEEKSRIDYFKDKMGLDETIAIRLSKLKSNSFYSFSRKFIMDTAMNPKGDSLMDLLFEDNTSDFVNEQMTRISCAVDKDGVYLDFSANKYENRLRENGGKLSMNLLMDDEKPVIPVSRPVLRALNETMKMYSAVIETYGVPSRVVIETARDLKDHTEVKQQSAKFFDTTKKLHAYLLDQLKEHKEYAKSSRVEDWDEIERYVAGNKIKIELYIRQNGYDLLTGESIQLNRLQDYQVDHILPRGFGDDSMDDKMLISRLANQRKGDRLPLEFIETGEKIGDHLVTSSEFIKRVESLYDMKLISDSKRKKLLMQSSAELETFINQNLVDTRYIIKEFMSVLRAYNKVHGYTTEIVSLKSAYTSLYRKAFHMDKVRDYGDQHHAHDAALLLVADKTLSTYFPSYDKRENARNSFMTYHDFIHKMMSSEKDDKHDLQKFIQRAFYYAYGVNYNSPTSIIEQIKSYVPYFSIKTEKNYKGKFFDAKSLKQDKYEDSAVLTIIGVNNKKHVFSSVECVAVDFYKVPVLKGKSKSREHIAVHIPKVIIDSNGNINKEKYMALIRNHYKKDILIDENGNLRTEFFRFRAFKNDIIYNTEQNCPVVFNIGSIVNRKLEFKFINMFSYNEIYKAGKEIAAFLIRTCRLKTKSNPDGAKFDDISKEVYVDYVARNYWNIDLDDKRIKSAVEKVKGDRNIYEISNHLSYLGLIIDRPGTPPTIDGQYLPVIDSKAVKVNSDTEYVKLKYNILGLKFTQSINGKLIVSSPKEIQGAYSKVKREEFSWKICRDDIE